MAETAPAIQTVPAEARGFQGERAGIVSRVLANAIDFAILLALLVAVYLSWSAFLFLRRGADFRFPTIGYRGAYLAGAVVLTVMFTVAWAITGRTYGDRVLGLRVISRRGVRLGFWIALIRALLCVAFPILLFWAIVDGRSVQDLIMRSSVIYDWAEQPSDPPLAGRS